MEAIITAPEKASLPFTSAIEKDDKMDTCNIIYPELFIEVGVSQTNA